MKLIKSFVFLVIKLIASLIGLIVILPFTAYVYIQKKSLHPRLIWGPIPIISNKYWARSLGSVGFKSATMMYPNYKINSTSDFDLYIHQILGCSFFGKSLSIVFGPYLAFIYGITGFDIFHHPISGGFLSFTPIWWAESFLLRCARKKVIVLPYGGDIYMYSKISDFSLRHALLLSYPKAAINELAITRRVKYWVKRADVIMPFFQMDGIGRWDVLPFSAVTIDTKDWICKSTYSDHDGINGIVKVVHTPNHRGFKGTEFLIEAIDDLQSEGLLVELILVEGKPNSEVKRIMYEEADILAEQFIVTAYALSAIEGMASGLPVLANLENESYTQVFRRYSYLNECPILSTSPENIKSNLRTLVTSPKLRRELGSAGRKFVEKYHSDEFAEYIFRSIYEKIYHHKNIDLMNLFHPLKSSYRLSKPLIRTPLIKNKLP